SSGRRSSPASARRRARWRRVSPAPTACWWSPIIPTTRGSICRACSARSAPPPSSTTAGGSSTSAWCAPPGCATRVSAMPRVLVHTRVVLETLDWLPGRGEVLFFASTSETYAAGVTAGTVPVPTPEDVPLSIPDVAAPRFAYAASKMVGEAAVLHTARARGLRAVVGRFHNVYGPRMGADHVIPELALRALRREVPFTLYGAEQRRAFCHVSDAVDAMVRLVATPAAWGRVVNVGNDTEETRIADLLALVLRLADFAPRVDRRPAPAGSVDRRCP